MKKQKKQSLLSTLIVILVIALIMMIGSIVYEEKININKQQAQDTIQQNEKDDTEAETSNEDELEDEEPVEEQEYVGEEENSTEEDSTLSKDEKAINLVKKEWGDDDSVTFSIVDKSGSKYRVSVISESTAVLQWYEVDTETWEVSEF